MARHGSIKLDVERESTYVVFGNCMWQYGSNNSRLRLAENGRERWCLKYGSVLVRVAGFSNYGHA
jgi:hypothetical protein